MTELTMVTVNSLGESLTQTLKHEKDIVTDHTIHYDLELYLNNYIIEFNKANKDNNVRVQSVKVYFKEDLVAEINANS